MQQRMRDNNDVEMAPPVYEKIISESLQKDDKNPVCSFL